MQCTTRCTVLLSIDTLILYYISVLRTYVVLMLVEVEAYYVLERRTFRFGVQFTRAFRDYGRFCLPDE